MADNYTHARPLHVSRCTREISGRSCNVMITPFLPQCGFPINPHLCIQAEIKLMLTWLASGNFSEQLIHVVVSAIGKVKHPGGKFWWQIIHHKIGKAYPIFSHVEQHEKAWAQGSCVPSWPICFGKICSITQYYYVKNEPICERFPGEPETNVSYNNLM